MLQQATGSFAVVFYAVTVFQVALLRLTVRVTRLGEFFAYRAIFFYWAVFFAIMKGALI
jgi:hypothetical protein